MSATKTVERMEQRVAHLIAEFEPCLNTFRTANLFTGPSLHFYFKTLRTRARYTEAVLALDDDEFFEGMYATLTAWGMHRMGPGNAKLADLSVIKASFQSQRELVRLVQAHQIAQLAIAELASTTDALWNLMAGLRVGIGETKIVANSKALHFLLPALVPPIDREYTIRFFYGHTTLSRGDEATFREVFPYLRRIAVECERVIRRQVAVRNGMDTCVSKVIDNAIVGYVRTYLPRKAASSLPVEDAR